MGKKTFEDNVLSNFKTIGNNQSIIVQHIKQVENRVKILELKVETIVSTATTLTNIYNQHADQIGEVVGTVLKNIKDGSKSGSDTSKAKPLNPVPSKSIALSEPVEEPKEPDKK